MDVSQIDVIDAKRLFGLNKIAIGEVLGVTVEQEMPDSCILKLDIPQYFLNYTHQSSTASVTPMSSICNRQLAIG